MIDLKHIKRLFTLTIFGLLMGCSSQNAMKKTAIKLQNDFDTHQYSQYVRAHLNAKKSAPSLAVKSKQTETENKQRERLAKRQLHRLKQRSNNRILNTLNNNGLYQSTSLSSVPSPLSNKSLETSASLDKVLSLALHNNLDIKSAKQDLIASLAKYDQVEYLDDTLKQYAAFTQDLNLKGSRSKAGNKHKKQSAFTFPHLLSLKSAVVEQSIEVERQRLKQTIQDVITKVRLAYIELQFMDAEIPLIKQELALQRSLKEELKNRYSSNTGELGDVLQADIDITKSQNSLQLISSKRKSQQAILNALLNLSPSFSMSKLDTINSNNMIGLSAFETDIHKEKMNNVEIAILQSELKKMKQLIQLSQVRFYPSFDAGFSRLENGQFSTKTKIKTNKTLAKDDAYLIELRQKAVALESKISALKTKTIGDAQRQLLNYQSADKTQQLYQYRIIPKAKKSLLIAKNSYEAGETAYVNVIKIQKALINYRLKSLKAMKSKKTSNIVLSRLIGT